MPSPNLRARSHKRHVIRLPSGKGRTIHHAKARVKAVRCNRCGRILSGVPSKPARELGRLPKSKKNPERTFGGQLCHACLQELLKQAVRSTFLDEVN